MVEKKSTRTTASKKAVASQEAPKRSTRKKSVEAGAYAIFKTGGKQYQAVVGKTVAIEKVDGEPGATVSFNEVLLLKTGADKAEVGTPFVKGAVVKATIVKHDKAPKVVVFKFKRRKKSRVKRGHRQPFTVVRIESI
jgi:large subunit ribosomal protein L21